MKRMAVFLYRKINQTGIPFFRGSRVESDLAKLHPGERMEELRTEYYGKKLGLFLTILLTGIFLGTIIRIKAHGDEGLDGERAIARGTFESGERELSLEADDGQTKKSFQIRVAPREPTAEELQEAADRFLAAAADYILNGNEDLRHVSENLKLEREYEGFPFEIFWESSREEILDSEGRLSSVRDPTGLELTAELVYGEWKRTGTISVTVVPPFLTEEEREYQELKEFLFRTEEESRKEENWKLPGEWKGREIRWRLQAEDYSFLVWGATPAVAVLVQILSDRDLHEKVEKRRRQMQKEYPELVYKLLLYMGAGMNIRGSFQKIGMDYEKKKKRSGRKKPSCEEVLYTCRELQGGVSEGAAYERFGKRAGAREYIRLGALLGQNLKRGSGTLLDRLREEAEKASGESLQQVKKLGEEAGTKLLLPMVMMLAVVMVMIMIPAFGTI